MRYLFAFVVMAGALLTATSHAAPKAVNTIAETLIAGMQAETDKDGKGLLQAAQRLDSLGAHPQDNTEDIARRWRQMATALGVKDTSSVTRGRTLGPSYSLRTLETGQSFATRQSFNAGQKADIAITPLMKQSLQLKISNDEGASICMQTVSDHSQGCSWVPLWTGLFGIEVTNTGPQPSRFYLITN
jgi:hypothetical protein